MTIQWVACRWLCEIVMTGVTCMNMLYMVKRKLSQSMKDFSLPLYYD